MNKYFIIGIYIKMFYYILMVGNDNIGVILLTQVDGSLL
jgi:hypothetical protein